MTNFSFSVNEETEQFCEGILNKMVDLFGISRSEALDRMNRSWQGLDALDDDAPLQHETKEYWAKEIYYGHDSSWWLNPPGLAPLPYEGKQQQ